MIIGPNPDLPALEASRIGVELRRALRAVAGDRADEVRSRGGGRVSVPVDIVTAAAEADSLPDLLVSDDALVLIALSADEEEALSAASGLLDDDEEEPDGDGEPDTGDASGPEEAPKVDPGDRSQFPRIDDLVTYADKHGIDLGGATRRADIEAAIRAHQPTPSPA